MEQAHLTHDEHPTVVVGLGASGGGIAALEQFFAELRESAGAAFVVILHLDPAHASSIAAILGRHSTMTFSEATHGEVVRRDRVYVIPPDRIMTIAGGVLRVQAPVERRELRMPIDRFLATLGKDFRGRAIGVVLSGTGSDGTIGLKAVKRAGGLTLVQDPDTTSQPSMARSAIEMRVVDHVLPVAQMPQVIARYAGEVDVDGDPSVAPSLNEELLTANLELQSKVGELEQRNHDMDNLLQSAGIAAIFLDREFRIMWFNPAMTALLNLLPTDTGRPLSDFAARYNDPDLPAALAGVLESGAVFSREVQTHDGHWYVRRALPYKSRTDRIDGVAITFTDINPLRLAELELQRKAEDLERRVANRTALLQLLQDVAAAANETTGIEDAVRAALKLVCTYCHWNVGHAWEMDERSGFAVPTGIWYVAPGHEFSEFINATMRSVLAPGDGLIRKTAATGKPQWVGDLRKIEFHRGNVDDFGIRVAATIPVPVQERVAMVLEIYGSAPVPSQAPATLTGRLVPSLASVGIQVGRVIERLALEKIIADQTERERRTLGDELHDTVGQSVAGLALAARELLAKMKDENSPFVESVAPLHEGLESAKDELRKVIRGMLPPELDGHGLMHAIIDLAEATKSRYGKRCRVVCEDPDALEIEDGFAGAQIYRIAQEALRNAVQHADASEITIALRGNEKFELEVSDNGHGDWSRGPARGAGISIMRYRAHLIGGRIEVKIEHGTGSRVRCIVPRRRRIR
jgi:signal transduction histidine kinase/PAS domain-containing protein